MQILRVNEVAKKIGMSRASIYRLLQEGNFPEQIRISHRAVGWAEEDIDNFLEKCRNNPITKGA